MSDAQASAFSALLQRLVSGDGDTEHTVGDQLEEWADKDLENYNQFKGVWLDARLAQLAQEEDDAGSAWNAAIDQAALTGNALPAVLLFLLARLRAQCSSEEFADDDERTSLRQASALHACRAALNSGLLLTAAALLPKVPEEIRQDLRAEIAGFDT
jgi:hypothetical protein